MYIKKAFIYGNLTRNPELKSLPSGTAVTNFAIATNRQWKDRDGNKREDAEFHNIVIFGKQAELVSQYLRKGSPVFIEGRIQTRSWDDANSGTKRYRTEIVADRVQFGPRGGGSGGGMNDGEQGRGYAPQSPQTSKKEEGSREELETIEYPEEESKSEDIPF